MVWGVHPKWVKIDNLYGTVRFFSIEGWNSWNHFHCNISETVVRQTADTIVATGLAAAGYQYGLFFSYFIYRNHYFHITFYSEFG